MLRGSCVIVNWPSNTSCDVRNTNHDALQVVSTPLPAKSAIESKSSALSHTMMESSTNMMQIGLNALERGRQVLPDHDAFGGFRTTSLNMSQFTNNTDAMSFSYDNTPGLGPVAHTKSNVMHAFKSGACCLHEMNICFMYASATLQTLMSGMLECRDGVAPHITTDMNDRGNGWLEQGVHKVMMSVWHRWSENTELVSAVRQLVKVLCGTKPPSHDLAAEMHVMMCDKPIPNHARCHLEKLVTATNEDIVYALYNMMTAQVSGDDEPVSSVPPIAFVVSNNGVEGPAAKLGLWGTVCTDASAMVIYDTRPVLRPCGRTNQWGCFTVRPLSMESSVESGESSAMDVDAVCESRTSSCSNPREPAGVFSAASTAAQSVGSLHLVMVRAVPGRVHELGRLPCIRSCWCRRDASVHFPALMAPEFGTSSTELVGAAAGVQPSPIIAAVEAVPDAISPPMTEQFHREMPFISSRSAGTHTNTSIAVGRDMQNLWGVHHRPLRLLGCWS